jgi:hypothetical protein
MALIFPVIIAGVRRLKMWGLQTDPHVQLLLESVVNKGKVHILPIAFILFDARIRGNRSPDQEGGRGF